ncbi:MAG: hypothetical protein AB7P69_12935 [Candidatus Binatia bacterium]
MLNPGERIAEWEVVQAIGAGGMGAVYQVRHFRIKETVLAMKVLLPDVGSQAQIRARFFREGEVMSAFEHKHIVRVFSSGAVHDERLNIDYILMEYIQGKTLHALLREKAAQGQYLEQLKILEFTRQAAQALSYAHNQDPAVIHRDIKPSNIMIADPILEPDNPYPLGRAVVMDWGIAKKLASDATQLTGMWTMIGTPRYCAPEQMRPLDLVEGSADIYSLGLVLYEMYAGKPFFLDQDPNAIVHKVRDDPSENEPHFDRPADPAFIALVRKAIAKDRNHRYRTIEEFLRDLDAYRQTLPDLTSPTMIPVSLPQKEENEQQQRRRSEELQRGLTLKLQAEARKFREKAVQAGAEEWAADLLQQGRAQEEEAEQKLQERHYFPAQDAYEEARSLFDKACGESLARGEEKAEQVRQAVGTVKAQAERYNARVRAQRFYLDGLSCEDEARGLEEIRQYRQAVEMYEKARTAFQDARDRAYDVLRKEVETVRTRALAEKEAARREGMQEEAVIVELFHEALQNEQQAAAALAQDDLSQSRALYHTASQKYEEARQRAVKEKHRRQVLQLRQQVDARRAAAEEKGADNDARTLYWRALETQRQGNAEFEAGRYEGAVRIYEQAQQEYEQAAQEAEQAQKQRLALARQELQEARAAAQRLGVETRLPSENEQAQHFAERGGASEQRGEFAQAAEYYLEAAKRFVELGKAAAEQQERERQDALEAQQRAQAVREAAEQVDAVREAVEQYEQGCALLEAVEPLLHLQKFREATESAEQAVSFFRDAEKVARRARERKAAEEAWGRVEQARGAAEQSDARVIFGDRFTQAQSLADLGREQAARKNVTQALGYYEQATQGFRQLQQDALEQKARRRADAARERMEERKTEIQAFELVGPKHSTAMQKEEDANRAWAALDYAQALHFYDEAEVSYVAAIEEAKELKKRQQALTEQEGAEQARSAAEQFQASLHAAVLYTQANEAQRQGEQLCVVQRWEAATRKFLHARELFTQARQKVQRELERQAEELERQEAEHTRLQQEAAEAQQQAAAAKANAEAAQARVYAEEAFRLGSAAQEDADRHFLTQDSRQAIHHYRQACEQFQQAVIESQREQARRAADSAHSQVKEVQEAAEQANVQEKFLEEHAQTVHLVEQGRDCEARQDFIQARQWYEQAARQFVRLHNEALREKIKETASVARRQMEEAKQRLAAFAEWLGPKWDAGQQQETEAHRAWRDEEYQQAAELFAQTRRTYEEAQIEAEEERACQGALTAQRRAQETQSQADAVEARKHAQALYEHALDTLQQGDLRFGDKQWEQATGQFIRAAQIFADAASFAQRATEQLAALEAGQEAERQERAADAAGAAVQCKEEFAQAHALIEQGQTCTEQQDFVRARSLYGEAAQTFVRLRQESLRQAAQKRADISRTQFLANRVIDVDLQAWAVALWAEAQEYARRAEDAYQEAQYDLAAELYESARQTHAHAQRAAARERAEQEASQAKHQALATRREAEIQEARRYATKLFTKGDTSLAEAERQFIAKRFAEATKTYRRACKQLADAATEAQRKHGELEATAAYEQAATAQTLAEEIRADQRLAQEFAQARRLVEEGQKEAAAGAFVPATHAYTQAASQFRRLRQQVEEQLYAEEEQRRQRGLEALRQAEQSQTAADEAQGRQYVPTQYQRGVEAKRQGEEKLAEKQWEDAEAHLHQAVALFDEVVRRAQWEQAKRDAESAQEDALEARRAASTIEGNDFTPESFIEAEKEWQEAKRIFAQEDFTTARTRFAGSLQLFRQAHQDAVVHVQRDQAEQARSRARTLQSQLQQVSTRKKRRAEKGLAAAEQLFMEQHYQEAAQGYADAAHLFDELLLHSGAGSASRPFPQQFVALVAGLAVVVVVIVIFVGRMKSTEEQQSESSPSVPSLEQLVIEPSPLIETIPAVLPSAAEKSDLLSPVAPLLQIIKATPEAADPILEEGKELPFSIEVESTQPKSVRYAWFIDGSRQSDDKQWIYKPGFDEADEKRKEVKVEVTDGAAQAVERIWQVLIENVNQDPRIVERKPETEMVETTAGTTPKFEVKAVDPDKGDKVLIEWFLDGQKRGEGRNWQLPTSLSAGAYQVMAKASDQAGAATQVAWNVALSSLSPLQVKKVSPDTTDELVISEGKELPFSIVVESAQPKSVRYAWFINGSRQSNGKQWVYKPGFDDGSENSKEVKVAATDNNASTVERSWRVRVLDVNRPPIIKSSTPKPGATVDLTAGEGKRFAVQASDPDRNDRLAFIWLIDGREVSNGERDSWQLPTTLLEGRHQVEVEVKDNAGLKAPQLAWNVVIKAPPAPPREPPPLSPPVLTKMEVQNWLANWGQAYARKDVKKLVELGVVKPADQAQVESILGPESSLAMNLENIEISLDKNLAKVSFTRTDVISGRSTPSTRISLVLEKGENGQIKQIP